MSTLAVAIGNSDDKLTQAEWADYCTDVRGALWGVAVEVFGEFASASTSRFQNACYLVRAELDDELRARLAELARDYGQESIAVAVGETEFVRGAP